MTHKVWKSLLNALQDVHGVRKGSPEHIQELIDLVDNVEEKYKSFWLSDKEIIKNDLSSHR